MNDFQISKNFNLQEFECTHKDHRHIRINEDLVNKLQELRDYLGVPLIINSAYRCPERNSQVGGATRSQHLLGNAVDISLKTVDNRKKLMELAETIGFNGIGEYNTFIHLDVRGSKARWSKR